MTKGNASKSPRRWHSFGISGVLLVALGTGALAQSEEQSTSDLARAVQNPIASLISLPFQNNTSFDWGPEEETFNVLNIQPVWPFQISDDWNLITRTIVPVVSQPGVVPGQDRETGLGDITFTAFLSPRERAHLGRWTGGSSADGQR